MGTTYCSVHVWGIQSFSPPSSTGRASWLARVEASQRVLKRHFVPSPSKLSKSGRVRLQFSHIDYETCSLLIQPPVSLSPRSQPPSSSLRAPPFRVSPRRRHLLRRPRRLRSASGVVASSVVDPVTSVLRRPRRFQVHTCTGFVPYCGPFPTFTGVMVHVRRVRARGGRPLHPC